MEKHYELSLTLTFIDLDRVPVRLSIGRRLVVLCDHCTLGYNKEGINGCATYCTDKHYQYKEHFSLTAGVKCYVFMYSVSLKI